MNDPSLTIFANFRIDNIERFEIMKISFNSFRNISASKWVINVRGRYKNEVINYLSEELGQKLSSNLIESGNGWFEDTKKLLPQIESDFVLFWVEDHINLVDESIYIDVLRDMKRYDVDHLIYSWWHNSTKETYSFINSKDTDNLSIYNMNIENSRKINSSLGNIFYIITMQSITTLNFFRDVILKSPRFRRWPKETPFDFEKISKDKHFYPFKTAIPKFELFANIDDDHDNEGYSLKSRGLFQNLKFGDSIREIENNRAKNKNFLKRIVPKFIYTSLGRLRIILRRIGYSLK